MQQRRPPCLLLTRPGIRWEHRGLLSPRAGEDPLLVSGLVLTIGTGSSSAADAEVCKPDARPDEDHGTAVLSSCSRPSSLVKKTQATKH